MSERRQLSLNLFIYPGGHHEAAWRHKDSAAERILDVTYYQELAQRAEAYYRAALRSPHIHVSKRSDCHIIEAPKESAAELVALALQSREE